MSSLKLLSFNVTYFLSDNGTETCKTSSYIICNDTILDLAYLFVYMSLIKFIVCMSKYNHVQSLRHSPVSDLRGVQKLEEEQDSTGDIWKVAKFPKVARFVARSFIKVAKGVWKVAKI